MALLTTTVGKRVPLVVPMVHLNGTSRDELLAQLTIAGNALASALVALHDAAPHARDYYRQSDDAYRTARAQHDARVAVLVDVRNELLAIHEAVADQQ